MGKPYKSIKSRMNIFVLNTGRCGSTTFIKACQHISNFSSSHESCMHELGSKRLDYPQQHIEADNRLSWFLGRLDKKYGDAAFYVHLKRDKQAVINSFVKREDYGIIKAYREGILMQEKSLQSPVELVADYVFTVEENINHFLKNKKNKMEFNLESAKTDFKLFWNKISAQGDIDAALSEWEVYYNAS